MKNLLNFTVSELIKQNDHCIKILQLDSDCPVDENSIKHKLLNCNETKIYQDLNEEFKQIKFNIQISNDDMKIMDKFINNILIPIISESNILWTSKFILNEIETFYPLEKRINDSKKHLGVMSPANPLLKYFKRYSYNNLLILIYHFWYETDAEDISWCNIKKIIKNCVSNDDFKKINKLINQNIFSKSEYDKATTNGISYYKQMKQYRNNLYAHITSKDTPELTKKGQTTYVRPQFPDINCLLHLANIVKIIGNLFSVNDRSIYVRNYETLHFTPNLYFASGGSCNSALIFSIKNVEEINLFYYIPKDWKEPDFI